MTLSILNVNVKSFLIMVGGQQHTHQNLTRTDMEEAFHNTSLRNKLTDKFEKSEIGILKYMISGHSVVPIDFDNNCK